MSTETHETPPSGGNGTFWADLDGGEAPGLESPAGTDGGAVGVTPASPSEGLRQPSWRQSTLPTEGSPHRAGTRERQEVEHRDVEPADVAVKLRGMLGLAPYEPAAGELAAGLPHPLPPLVRGLDSGAWIGWCVIGLALFGEGFPSLAAVRREPKRFTMALAMVRAGGNISAAARMLGASRKVLRENLHRAGLHPWLPGSR